MPTDVIGGAPVYVTGTGRSSVSTLSLSPSNLSYLLGPGSDSSRSTSLSSVTSSTVAIENGSDVISSDSTTSSPSSSFGVTPPPAYHSIYPPSPPSSAPSSPVGAFGTGSHVKVYSNPLQAALSLPSTPVKPVLTARCSSDKVENLQSTKAKNGVELLATIFAPDSPIHSLPAQAVSLNEIAPNWHGAVLENPAIGTRTLYVCGGSYEDVNLRESVCGVLEMAEEDWSCSGVVMCLKKSTPHLGDLLHSLMYVGGTITTLPYPANSAHVLVGLDL